MAIDYDTEYNNRARVKEHPEILARMAEASAAYREERKAKGLTELRSSYGWSGRQMLDIFLSEAGRDAPVMLFIHGGYWRALQPSDFSIVARGLNAHGVTVALAGYDLCPQVGIGDIVNQLRRACYSLWRRFGKRIVVCGHSAGGHAAAAMLATDWPRYGAPAGLVPAGIAISGLFDLKPLMATTMNADFKLDAAEAGRLSPLFWTPPAGTTFDAIVGAEESGEYLRQSRTLAEAWSKSGVTTRYEAVAGANHFTVIEPLADPDGAMVKRLAQLARDAG
jgi:arylformamidase